MKSNKNKSAVWRAALAALLGMAVFFACTEEGHGKGKQDVDVEGSGKYGNSEGLSMEDYPYELGAFEGLDAETEWQILQDYFDTYVKSRDSNSSNTINDFYINNYCGTYHDYVVVTITEYDTKKAIPQALVPPYWRPPYIVGDIKFTFPPLLWNNRQFYDLNELYGTTLFTYNDIENIALHYYPEDFDESNWRIK